MKIKHKVITAKDGKDLEKQLNKHSADQWLPSTNPIELRDGGFMVVMSKQIMPTPTNVN